MVVELWFEVWLEGPGKLCLKEASVGERAVVVECSCCGAPVPVGYLSSTLGFNNQINLFKG